MRLKYQQKKSILNTHKKEVNAFFHGKSRKGDWRLLSKAIFFFALFFCAYFFSLFGTSSIQQFLGVALSAIAAGGIGFNIFHDANHDAFSSRHWLNNVLSILTSTLLGPSRYLWKYKHNIYHHTYVNVHGWDDDLETRGMLRLCEHQEWKKSYRHQHQLFLIYYAFSTIEWFFVKDFVQYFTLKMTHQPIPPMKRLQKVEFWLSKFFYFLLFLLIPLMVHGISSGLIKVLFFHVVLGLVLTFIIQLAHYILSLNFPDTHKDSTALESSWDENILKTTANFATNNRLLSWFCGGLNYQIEHHFFPSVCHIHYPDLSHIVKHGAKDMNLPYHDNPSYINTLIGHYQFLKKLSQPTQESVHEIQ